MQEAGKRLNDNGSVVTIVTALLGAFTDGYSTYAGSKSPVEHFTALRPRNSGPGDQCQQRRARADGHALLLPAGDPERVEFHKSQAMGNRLTQIEDIAPLVLFLLDGGHWITGQTVFANGGYTTR